MNSPVRFGTDGWRGRIAYDFTFENVARAARAMAETFRERSPKLDMMIVGHDRRFLSRAFAQTAATIYASADYDVLLAETYLPTPVLSWATKHMPGVAAATVITASHNPPSWNGFKIKEPFGGSAPPTTTRSIEEKIVGMTDADSFPPMEAEFENASRAGAITPFNPWPKYVRSMLKQVDVKTIKKAKLKIAVDTMFGAASNHYSKLLRSIGVDVEALHEDDNPGFCGVAPEPIAKNLLEIASLVKRKKLRCGLATDGDSDRLGAIDEKGNYFTTQQILSLVYWHMLRHRKKHWSIARSVSTTRMVDLVASRVGQRCYETPVGFKYIAEKMVAGDAQIGGEESGGIGIIDHIPERDGILTGLLLLEIIAVTGKGLKANYDELCREERPYYFTRLDLHITKDQMESAMSRLNQRPPGAWDGRKVKTPLMIDGFKYYLEDGAWILIRPSGTEPIFRLYAEAETQKAADHLVDVARRFVVGT